MVLIVLRFPLPFQSHVCYLVYAVHKKMTGSKFHTEDPHILGVTVQNLVTQVTWRRGFVRP
jgi:hypothetical protein